MDVIRLKNPQVLLVPDVGNLIKRAVESVGLAAPGGFDSIATDVYNMTMDQDAHFIVLGAEEGHFHSICMGHFPQMQMFPYPTILLFYNDGSPALRRATMAKTMDILLERGYTGVWAVNLTGKPDEPWARLFTVPDKTEAKRLGSVYTFEVK